MYKKAWCTCKVVVLLIWVNLLLFLPFSLPSPSSLLKAPDVTHRDSQRHVSRNTELQCCNYVVAMRNNVAAMLKALGTRLKKNNKNNNCSNSSAVEFQLILWIILNLDFALAKYIMAYKTTLRNDQLFFPYVVTVVMLKCGWQRSTHSPLMCRQHVASVTRQFSDIVFCHSFMNHLSFWYFVRASFELSVCVMISFFYFFSPFSCYKRAG